MISRKPFADRNDNPLGMEEDECASPQKRKETKNFEPNGRNMSTDSGFVSPETICRPKLTASRRSSPANAYQPFASFRLEDSSEPCHVAETELPSRAIADLWTKPLKTSGLQLSAKGLGNSSMNSEGSNTPNRWGGDLPPTKLSFDSCESSADETSPPTAPNLSRKKDKSYRRSLSYAGAEASQKEVSLTPILEGTPVFNPKRHKFESDENSPYKSYLEKSGPHHPAAGKIGTRTRGKGVLSRQAEDVSALRSSSLTPEVKRLCLTRSQSESSAILLSSSSIKNAVERIESNPCLIGDGSKSYILPFKVDGKHQDLKEITGETLSELMNGNMKDSVTSFKVIDCRYPYEFDGGHIQGAINLFTKKQVYEELMQPKLVTNQMSSSSEDRNILIFHCEFSSQRGPEMCRFLRDSDRESNATNYPSLHYPELYVLFGGYKSFFAQFSNLCHPQEYLPMDHPKHVEDCRKFKSKAKLESQTSLGNPYKKSKSRTAQFAKKCNF